MPDLLVLRHAKSSWKDRSLEDHDRPLNKRGRKAAPRMGRLMVEENLIPDLLLCSTATRARETWRRLNKQAGWTIEERFLPAFYPGDPVGILQSLRDLPERVRSVLVVGHNPCLEQLVLTLTGTPVTMPTAALVHLRADGPWASLHSARMLQCWLPRQLEDPS